MSIRHHAPGFWLLLVLALFVGACSSPRVNFYTLRSTAEAAPAAAASDSDNDYRVMVGPVTIPDMVDRPQMVVRVASHQMVLLDQHRWAEPLKSEIPLVIADNLSKLLGTREVTVHSSTWKRGRDIKVRIDVQRFDSVQGDGATLEAYWSVANIGDSEVKTGRFAVHIPVQGSAHAALAEAHGTALRALSQEVAAAIQTQRTKL